jgi:NitT/TauT family transport system ATP-binding protein
MPLTFSIAPGEFVSLLGPSGSGKSTLLRMIAGLETADSGSLRVESGSRSFVFQDAALLPWRTVLQNVMLPLELTGAHRASARAGEARDALAMVGLADAADLYPNQLSGGMKMRVSVARALVSKPSLLLFDEPFAALDERTRHRLQEDLRSLWLSFGMTVVFVTHSASEAVFVSDRAIVLSGSPGRVLDDHAISLGRERTDPLRSDPRYIEEIAYLNGVSP